MKINNRPALLILLATSLATIWSCGDDLTELQGSTIPQEKLDIDAFIAAKGYTNVDTTPTGVRYAIIDEGESKKVQSGDLIAFNLVGSYLYSPESIFWSSVVDSVSGPDSSILWAPFRVTYSTNGWSFANIFTQGQFGEGLEDGLIATLPKLGTGGQSKIFVPSSLGIYGSGGPYGDPLIYDVYLTDIR